MPDIHVYEPALCCNTGVCGPDLDETLVTFTADLQHVSEAGGSAQRHNLANDPQAFADSETVRSFLQVAGSAGLPLTTVDGVTVLTGRYPSRDELLAYVGLKSGHADLGLTAVEAPAASGGCCGGSGCC